MHQLHREACRFQVTAPRWVSRGPDNTETPLFPGPKLFLGPSFFPLGERKLPVLFRPVEPTQIKLLG